MSKKMKILVVDDSAMIRSLIRKELQAEGYQVVEATDGPEALRYISTEPRLDLITLDIDMPKMDGFETCRLFLEKQNAENPNYAEDKRIPVVFITANDKMNDRVKGFNMGATDFVTKPFPKGNLLEIVNKILKPKQFLKGMTALVVDDSDIARNIITENLHREGLITIEATNGMEAYEIIKKRSEEIDIIISDLLMPEMDGEELCIKIRKELNLLEIPVLVLTAIADHTKLLSVFQAGATDYIVKPFFKEELLARINVHLEQTQLNQKLKNIIQELQTAQEEKAAKEKMQGALEMAGAICHEMNQPLQNITGFAEILGKSVSKDNPAFKNIDMIKDQIDHLGDITNKLMHITRYTTKAYIGDSKIFDIEQSSD
jgi:two-component system cell cycle response regulator